MSNQAQKKAWVSPKLSELSVDETLTATVTGSIEVITSAGREGRCCS